MCVAFILWPIHFSRCVAWTIHCAFFRCLSHHSTSVLRREWGSHTACSPAVLRPELPFRLRATRHPASNNSTIPATHAIVHTVHDGEEFTPALLCVDRRVQAATLVKMVSLSTPRLVPVTSAMRLCIRWLNAPC